MTQEDQPISGVNSHIEKYLDYYCGLSHAPGFAILLKGEWGCGKTWFINKYREKLEKKNKKFLYVSLYGMTSFSEIENSFFQQLHPVLSSKGMAITGTILKGLLKGALKIDLDGDKQDDGSLSIQIPEINLPEYLKNTDKCILIFDDLERCQIDIENLLGYINYFVEHQDLKVIMVANEVKLERNDNYKNIKEKLIGKTFDIARDLHGALESFTQEIDNSNVKSFLLNNKELIEEIYLEAKYENLRSLKQIILDFERIFQELPEKSKSIAELLKKILRLLLAFSIEVKRGSLLPKNINRLKEAQEFEYNESRKNYFQKNKSKDSQNSLLSPSDEEDNKVLISLKKIIDQHQFWNLLIYEPLPNLEWWQDFLNLGKINENELKQSILNSKYFADENTPNWIRLWHFYDTDMTDNEFHILLEKVEAEYADKEFIEIGEILHVTGVFFNLCNSGLYPNKTKQDILHDAKDYIDDLVNENQLDLSLIQNPNSTKLYSPTGYQGLGYQGIELDEFKEFNSYISEAKKSALEQKLPQLGLELLDIMQRDKWQFHRMLCMNNFSDYQEWDSRYSKIPILKYIAPQDFMNRFLSMSFYDKGSCLGTFSERYESVNFSQVLQEELPWLKNIQELLLEEANNKQYKLRGYKLKFLSEKYLSKALEKLSNDEQSN
ncbi:MAG: P-loop NTPase fold protein [Cyanobacteria bacterium P01_G01_bin.39]